MCVDSKADLEAEANQRSERSVVEAAIISQSSSSKKTSEVSKRHAYDVKDAPKPKVRI